MPVAAARLAATVTTVGTVGPATVRSSLDAPAAPGAESGLYAAVRVGRGRVTTGPVTRHVA